MKYNNNNNNILIIGDMEQLIDGIRKIKSKLQMPVKIFYTEDQGVTVVLFSDGSKIKTIAENNKNKKVHNGVLIAMAKKYFPNIKLRDLYTNKSSEDKFAELTIKHLVMGYLIGSGTFKNEKEFSKWFIDLLSEKVNLVFSKDKSKNKELK